ncbi:MAG TPA: SDR family NAD(P)-dependent oxidoreductase [Ensifer sp.]|nr:SDR family NAD(P)-dependent oxidoreductase [Ensifer sp.]
MTDFRNLFSLEGKRALITGACGGLGSAISDLFASAGARLILSDVGEPALAERLSALDATRAGHASIPLDLSDLSAVRAQMKALVAQDLVPDCLVLNAGMQGPAGPLCDIGEADWNQVMTVNLASAHAICSELLPVMSERGGGSVIFMASIAGLRGNKAIGLYGLTKAALAQMARNLAVEWGPRNIRANAIAPGLIRTPLSRGLMGDDAFMQRRLAMTPLRRVGEADEIAGAALFLSSAAGAFVTGQTIVVDGGTLISDGG